jgi:Ribosome biogenesis regulatory protein (RRS1)
MAESETKSKLPVQVSKPTPYTFDLGLLCASDPNPLQLSSKERLEEELAAIARDGAQALLNQLLSTCPITSTPAGVLLSLPGISTPLPREKVCFSILFLSSFPDLGEFWRGREREREMLIRDIATTAPESPNHLAKIRSQEGHQE